MVISTRWPWLLTDCGEGRMIGPIVVLDSLLRGSPVQARFEQHAKMWWRNPLHNLLCKTSRAYNFVAQCQCYMAQVYALDDYSIRRSYLKKLANRVANKYSLKKTSSEVLVQMLKSKVI